MRECATRPFFFFVFLHGFWHWGRFFYILFIFFRFLSISGSSTISRSTFSSSRFFWFFLCLFKKFRLYWCWFLNSYLFNLNPFFLELGLFKDSNLVEIITNFDDKFTFRVLILMLQFALRNLIIGEFCWKSFHEIRTIFRVMNKQIHITKFVFEGKGFGNREI